MNQKKKVITAYVQDETKTKLRQLKEQWHCSESAAIARLILEKKLTVKA